MQLWQDGLVLLAGLWACQSVGTWKQMRHYRGVMGGIGQRWPDGAVGASAARATFGRGVVAIVVASPDRIVRQVLLMEGRSVFATFREHPELAGGDLAALPEAATAGRRKALAGAVAQIETTFAEPARAAAPRGGEPALALLAA